MPVATAIMSRRAAARWFALGVLALAVAPAWAVDTPIYKCFDNHLSLVYTDLPCKDGEVVDIRAGNADPSAVARLERARDQLDQSAAERTRDERRAADARSMAWLPDDDEGASQAAPSDYGYGYLPYQPLRPPRRPHLLRPHPPAANPNGSPHVIAHGAAHVPRT